MEKQDRPHKTEGRGRATRKRQVAEIARLAERLVELPASTLPALPLDDELRAELLKVRRVKGRGSKKRSLKYLASLLRGEEETCEALQAALALSDGGLDQDAAELRELEMLREQLCSADQQVAAMEVVRDRYPAVDPKALQRLTKAVQLTKDKRAFREIFRRLREGKLS